MKLDARSPIRDPRSESAALESLIASFEACTVPREQWNHRAHLAYALVMLRRHGPVLGSFAIRDGILRYNAAQRIEQTLDSGYHETLTRFYIWVVQQFLAGTNPQAPLPALLDELCERYGDRDLPYRYYSRERLKSWEARTRWLEPDLRRLP